MKFIIVGKPIEYNRESIVYRLGNFILDNTEYFGAFCNILIRAKGRKLQAMVDIIIKTDIEKGKLNTKQLQTFQTLLSEYFIKIDRDGENTRGKIVEFLIANIGPISFESEPKYVVKECWVEDENKNRVGGEKNFDVGFHCNCKSMQDLSAELIESKLDLNNFLSLKPFDPSNLTMSLKAVDKLEYIEIIKETLSPSKHLVVALATVRYNVELSRKIMEQYGYDKTIEIFDYNHLKQAMDKLNTAS